MLQSHTRFAIAASVLVAATTAAPRAIGQTRSAVGSVLTAAPLDSASSVQAVLEFFLAGAGRQS